jgi:heterodisulfide reductase subunit A2
VEVGGIVAVVDQDKCAVCLTCVRTCPFDVPIIDYTVDAAYIDPAKCQGCGVCVSECPAKAITCKNFTDAQIIAGNGPGRRVREGGVMTAAWSPKIICFCCRY